MRITPVSSFSAPANFGRRTGQASPLKSKDAAGRFYGDQQGNNARPEHREAKSRRTRHSALRLNLPKLFIEIGITSDQQGTPPCGYERAPTLGHKSTVAHIVLPAYWRSGIKPERRLPLLAS